MHELIRAKRRQHLWGSRLWAPLLTLILLATAPALLAQHPDHPPGMHEDQDTEDPHAHHREMLGQNQAQVEKTGDLRIPDVPLLTQDGDEVRFFSDLVEGKVVVMNFVFTTCTTICPPLGANFGKLQQILGDKAGSEIYLISVSVDPVTDTPERLKAWGKVFGAGPGWTLVTGSKAEVTRLLKALQVFTPDFNDHSPVVLMGNAATGEWTRAYGLAPPKDLAAILEGMAGSTQRTAQAKGGSR